MKTSRGIAVVLVGVVVCVLAPQATAGMIGVNFTGDGTPQTILGTNEAAGVVSQSNWNNVDGASGTNVALNDNTGPSGAQLTFSAYSSYARSTYGVAPNPPLNNDEKLFNGCLYSLYSSTAYTGGKAVTITVNDIPAAYQASGYDVYIYMDANENIGCYAQITAGSTNWYADGGAYLQTGHLTYTQITSTDHTNPTVNGNYVLVTGQSASNFTFSVQTDPNAPHVTTPEVFGFQIVQVPEPATMVLLALGGILTLSRRRR